MERKVANIRRFHSRNPDWFARGFGANWLALLRKDDEGKTREEFEGQLLNGDAFAEMQRAGAVRSAAELLAVRRYERSPATSSGPKH